jgi:hypothetical protein
MRTRPWLAWTLFALCCGALAMAPAARADEDDDRAPGEKSAAAVESAAAVDHCVACHTEEDLLPEGHLAADIHMQPGLSCAGCHGGNPASDDQETAMSKAAGFRGVPAKKDIPAFCGRCHSDIEFMRAYQPRIPTDQVDQYFTSVHGHRLKQGDTKVADCTSCHTAHGILPASDTRSTVHALNVPATCGHCHGDPTYNDCHGNHGATPPGITSIGQVCGHCHVNNMQYFTDSRMGRAFVEEGYHGCEECHGNHGVHKTSDAMVGTGEGAVCTNCHSDGDNGFEAAGRIHAELADLDSLYTHAVTAQEEVQRIGMDDVDIAYLLQESHQSLIQARTLVHTFDPERVRSKTAEGVEKAKGALDAAAAQVKDYHVRRRGFGMATLFTTVLALALFMYIRQMEAKP